MKLSPTLDHVVVRPSARPETSDGGTVVASGRGAFESGVFVENTVKPGDLVVLERHRLAQEIVIEGERLLIVPHRSIVAVLLPT